METILCPTGFSPSPENAIQNADEPAQRMNSRIMLFHSISEPVGSDFVSYTGVPYPGLVPDPPCRQAQQSNLNELKSSLQDTDWGTPIDHQTRIAYDPAKDTMPARWLTRRLLVIHYRH